MAISAIAIGAAYGAILFEDSFAVTGTHLDYSKWTTVTGPASYLGRTQLADWTPSGSGQFVVGPSGAQLTLSTFNPTGFSLYGTNGVTLASFQPTAGTAIEFDTTLRLTSLQPGLVYGMYLYGCNPALCATNHDEIDIEVLTNTLQPGGPLQVQLNRYANEPLGAGNGGLFNLPSGFDPLAAHRWTILWSSASVEYLVDGVPLDSETTHVPQGEMQANEIAWGPASDWAAAFDASLQPVTTAAANQSFTALITSVTVSQIPTTGPVTYQVGDVAPYATDTAPDFGDGILNILDLIQELFAVNNVTGFRPAACSDRFDAMDLYPADTATTRGGDGVLDIRDLTLELFRVNNLDPARPVRASLGGVCAAASGSSAVRTQAAAQGALALGRPEPYGGTEERVPVYLAARQDLARIGVTLALGDQRSPLSFVSAEAAPPSLVQDSERGIVAAAWLNGVSVRAGERMLLGYVQGPAGATANLEVYGVSASGLDDNREILLEAPAVSGQE